MRGKKNLSRDAMENEEFNLSVLENTTNFSSPLNDFANHQTIFSLIKEEIDISTEDETAGCQKDDKSPYLRGKRKESESHDSERMFKSPYKRRYSLNKLASPANLLNKCNCHEWRRKHVNNETDPPRRTTSLGTVKPGRSFLADYKKSGNYKKRNSVSHSSETSNLSDFYNGDDSIIAKIILENENSHTECNASLDNILEILENARETFEDERKTFIEESASLAINDPPNEADNDNDFVESSQTTACSNLRRRLMSRRSAIQNDKLTIATKMMESNLQRKILQSENEDEDRNCVFAPSPSSKSHTSTREVSTPEIIPQRSRKRKATSLAASSPPEVSTPKQKKNNRMRETSAVTSPQSKMSKNSESPLKGLTQELENCIMNSDYEQITKDIEADFLERTSFTFETIELLNDYDHANSHTNNQILSEILSSPMEKHKKEPLGSLESVAVQVQPNEDPLYIEENEANIARTSSTVAKKKKITPKSRKTSERKSKKFKETKGTNSSRKSSLKETTEPSIIPPAFKIKKMMEKVSRRNNRKSKEGETRESDEQLLRNVRLRKKKKIIKRSLSDLEDDENLAVEAAKVSKKVEAAEKKATLSDEILQKLDNLVIRLRHQVLPQHEIETRAGSATLSYQQQKEFIKLAPLNKNTYSPAEDDIIRENWKAFCEEHDWDPKDYKPFLLLKHGHHLIMSSLDERRKFVQFLANGLPNRPLYSVYSRFKLLYNKYAAAGSRYTQKEDTKILAHMLHNASENPDKKCSELAKILDRSRVSVWKRYKKLMAEFDQEKEKKVLTKVAWDLPLAQDFIRTLLDVTLSEELIDLKDAFIPKVVWLKMQEKMEINHELMKRFWEQQLHLQLFSPEPLYINQIKITLIEHMYEKKFRHPREIKWNNIVKYFDGQTASFLRKVFNHLTAKASTSLGSRNLKTILKWLYTKQIQQLRNEPKDKYLPRISYENEKAQILGEDLKGNRHSLNVSERD